MRTTTVLFAAFAVAIILAPAAAAKHTIEITSGKPKKGEYTMTVEVANFNLVPFAGKQPTKGEGHIHYLVNGAPAEGDYATPSKSFTFKGLKAGDKVGAELVLSDHSASGTDAAGTLDGSRVLAESSVASSMGIPALPGVALAVALVGLAALARRR